jgi:hypothetical protein
MGPPEVSTVQPIVCGNADQLPLLVAQPASQTPTVAASTTTAMRTALTQTHRRIDPLGGWGANGPGSDALTGGDPTVCGCRCQGRLLVSIRSYLVQPAAPAACTEACGAAPSSAGIVAAPPKQSVSAARWSPLTVACLDPKGRFVFFVMGGNGPTCPDRISVARPGSGRRQIPTSWCRRAKGTACR